MPTLRHLAHARSLAAVLASWLVATVTVAAAQASFDHPDLGFRFAVPAGWEVNEEADDGEIMLFLASTDGGGAVVVAAGPLTGSEREAYASGGIAGLVEPGFALVSHLPDARRVDVFTTVVGGREAVGFTYQAGEIAGRFVIVVADERIYALGSLAEPSGAASTEAALAGVLDSFTLTAAAAIPPPGGADPFVGTFVGDGLTVTIGRAPDGGYVGSVTHGAATYPLTAIADTAGLTGHFTSGADTFPFVLGRAGDTLVFTTGGTRYTLSR